MVCMIKTLVMPKMISLRILKPNYSRNMPVLLSVAHHIASIERSFLEVACQRCFGRAPRLKFIDTMQIEWQRLLNQGKVVKPQSLRLPNCLARHHLPQSQSHHALEDAYSCALLLLCQMKQHRQGQLQLQDVFLLSRG